MNEYNLAAIRGLLKDAFTAQDLWRFCQERPAFQPVLLHFPFNATPAQMIDALTEFCRTQALFDELLAEIRLANPRQYERYQAQLAAGSAAPAPGLRIPHNLPPRTEFVGREKEKARIHEALRSRYFLISIEGIGGIGKTSLALEAAYECLQASQVGDPPEEIAIFDCFIWATAKDRDLTLSTLLDTILLTLDYPGVVQRPLEQKRFAVEKMLREHHCLLLVDNFETVMDEGVWGLLRNLPEPSKALITTREPRLGQVWSILLKGLEEPESLALVRGEGRRLGLDSIVQADEKTLLYLHKATGGAPLAIKWAVGQIKQRGQSLDTVLAALHEARGSLFDEIFARSWSLLSTQARDVLLVMPLFATSASREAIEFSSGVSHFAFDDALGQLVEMSLVEANDELSLERRRYSVHPLTRAFAAEQLRCEPNEENTVLCRLSQFFQQLATRHGGFRNVQGFRELEPDLPNIVGIIQRCCEAQPTADIYFLFLRISPALVTLGYWSEVLTLARQLVARASALGDNFNAARFMVWPISWIYRHRGDLAGAEEQLTLAITIFDRLGQDVPWAKRNLARVLQEKRDFSGADRLLREALEANQQLYGLKEELEEPPELEQNISLSMPKPLLLAAYKDKREVEQDIHFIKANLAEVALQRGDVQAAQQLAAEALARARTLDDPELVASLLNVLARVAILRGENGKAKELWQEALDKMRQAGRRDGIADAQVELARLEMEMSELWMARQRLAEALDHYNRLDIPSKASEVEGLLTKLSKVAQQIE